MKSTKAALLAAPLVAAALVAGASGADPKFFDDDPIAVERDTQDASGMKEFEIGLFVDVLYNLFATPGDKTPNVRARNVNTIDEVPDSNWFTNRAGVRPLTAAEITKGPNRNNGPAAGRWTVVASKSDGVTPGFTITDSAGDRWFIKVDPPGFRAMATGPEVIVTKLFWALGYFVPENHLAVLRREDLVMGDTARYTPASGVRRPMRLSDIDMLLKRAHKDPDGTYRVVASRALEGTPVGPFRFHGTRPDDPNDLVPHEHRRELRGIGTFGAWVSLVDSKSGNMLDMLIKQDGRSVVRHYVQDLGATLGTGGIEEAEYWEGHEYLVEGGETAKRAFAFGFYLPSWQTQPLYEDRPIGRFPRDNKNFDPDKWKPRIPNPAFLRARADDKFWAARKLMALNDELVRAAVQTGELGDERAEVFLGRALTERRDAIVRTYFTAINPVSDPAFDGTGLTFKNLAVDAGVAKAPAGYKAAWSRFDNATGTATAIGETSATATRIASPSGLPQSAGTYIKVEVRADGGDHPEWQKPVHVYFRRVADGWKLVGFERMPEG